MEKEIGDLLKAFGIPKLAEDQRVNDADDRDVNGGGGLNDRVREVGPGREAGARMVSVRLAAIRRLVRMVKKLK